ncbi:hypothetical protein [Pontibacillus halophilus]|uniref:hypothetical protein n=1 Tax=Pontibacillus halophilus TaxID=516704 RepID=UPI00040C6170|nr:hypothetical protein [Pontibacillus halophilus]
MLHHNYNSKESLEEKRKKEKIEMVLNHQVDGESFIAPPSREWKRLILYRFNDFLSGKYPYMGYAII